MNSNSFVVLCHDSLASNYSFSLAGFGLTFDQECLIVIPAPRPPMIAGGLHSPRRIQLCLGLLPQRRANCVRSRRVFSWTAEAKR